MSEQAVLLPVGELPPLRPPVPAVPVEPLEVAPDPGAMGPMYIGARAKYKDGMTLALARPRLDYEQIKREYARLSREPGFSDVTFFERFFQIHESDDQDLFALPGQSIDDYVASIREKFIFPNTRQGHFDVWLPYDRSVAGAGRFGEHSFLWDGYHMAKGYAAAGRWDLVLNVLDNTEYQINVFGHPLNGSALFYATRPQPDYTSHMVRMVADRYGPEAYVRYLDMLEKNHLGYWMDGMDELAAKPQDGQAHAHRALVRMPDGSFQNRYWDDGEGPRLESYKEDVELGELAVAGLSGVVRERRLRKFYKDQRAGAASGWDYSSRWFADGRNEHTINTTDIIPVDLACLMVHQEETLEAAYRAAADTGGHYSQYLGRQLTAEECLERAGMYRAMREQRVASINKYCWDPHDKIFRDYNHAEQYQTAIVSAAMVYPLYVGIVTEEQTYGVADAVERELLYEGGVIATTTEDCNTQWDGGVRGGKRSKNVWAPFNWAAARAFARMGHILVRRAQEYQAPQPNVERLFRLAERIKAAYLSGIEVAYKEHHLIPEKHRGDDPATLANGGEYELVKVLAMPAETYCALKELDPRDAADHLPRRSFDLAA